MLNEPRLSFYFLRLRFKSPAPSFVSLSLVFYVYVFSMTSTTEIILKHVEEEVYGEEHEDAFAFFRIFIINKFSEYISVHHGILQRCFSPLVKPSSAWTSFFRKRCSRSPISLQASLRRKHSYFIELSERIYKLSDCLCSSMCQ